MFDFEGVFDEIVERTPGWSPPHMFKNFSDIRFLSLGPTKAGLPFHNHHASIFWLVHGWKRWYILPPVLSSKVRAATLMRTTWDWLATNPDLAALPDLYQCTQKPGEVLFVPEQWSHATLSVGTAVGFSLQSNPPTRALAEIEEKIAQHPLHVPNYIEKASKMQNDHDILKVLQAAHRMNPSDLRVWPVLLQVLVHLGRDQVLKKEVDNCVKTVKGLKERGELTGPGASMVLTSFGKEALGTLNEMQLITGSEIEKQAVGSSEAIIKVLEEAVGFEAESCDALTTLARAKSIQASMKSIPGQWESAERLLSECLRINPAYEEARGALPFVQQQVLAIQKQRNDL